jgi:hypothetical protein
LVHLLHDAILDIFECLDWEKVKHLNTELLDVITAQSVLNEAVQHYSSNHLRFNSYCCTVGCSSATQTS